jgi:hypothetical protein
MQEFYLLKRKQALKRKNENPGCKAAKRSVAAYTMTGKSTFYKRGFTSYYPSDNSLLDFHPRLRTCPS